MHFIRWCGDDQRVGIRVCLNVYIGLATVSSRACTHGVICLCWQLWLNCLCGSGVGILLRLYLLCSLSSCCTAFSRGAGTDSGLALRYTLQDTHHVLGVGKAQVNNACITTRLNRGIQMSNQASHAQPHSTVTADQHTIGSFVSDQLSGTRALWATEVVALQ